MKNSSTRRSLRRLTYSALCLALCLALPQLLGRIPEINKILSPMHLPVYLAGLIAGPFYGLVVGVSAPLLNFLFFGRPLFVSMVPMLFELGGYGFFAGLFEAILPKKKPFVYLSLSLSMVLGRCMGGVGKLLMLSLGKINAYGLGAFLTGYFASGALSMALTLLIIPMVTFAVRGKRVMYYLR